MEPNSSREYISQPGETVFNPTNDEKTLAILSHVLTLVVSILAPLIIYLLKKDESEYVARHAKESLNFQLTAILVSMALAITVIGLLFLWIIWVVVFVFVIIATVKANDNKFYRYPLTIRFIK